MFRAGMSFAPTGAGLMTLGASFMSARVRLVIAGARFAPLPVPFADVPVRLAPASDLAIGPRDERRPCVRPRHRLQG
jgi:hypothetical protein